MANISNAADDCGAQVEPSARCNNSPESTFGRLAAYSLGFGGKTWGQTRDVHLVLASKEHRRFRPSPSLARNRKPLHRSPRPSQAVAGIARVENVKLISQNAGILARPHERHVHARHIGLVAEVIEQA